MIIPYTISTLYLIGAALFTFIMPADLVNILCGVETLLYPSASIACLALRAITASGSTMVMAAVVCIMKRRMQHVAKTHQTVAHGNISFFVRNQSRFTITMIFSSIATIVLFVAPTCYQLVAQIFAFNHETMDSVAVYLSNINSFNMVCVVVVKQNDIQMSLLGCLTCGKHFLEPANERNIVTVPERSHVECPYSSRSTSFAPRAGLPEHVIS
ncbi:unnamed protein product [Toxocara canis]|nr:unnamed protein product [Toxocara canis]